MSWWLPVGLPVVTRGLPVVTRGYPWLPVGYPWLPVALLLRPASHGFQQLLVPLANQLRIHKTAELMPDMVEFCSAKLFVHLASNARLELDVGRHSLHAVWQRFAPLCQYFANRELAWHKFLYLTGRNDW